MQVEDIGLTFTLPGYNDVELTRCGSDRLVDINNLGEYVNLIFDKLCLEGPRPLVDAFKTGFNRVFDVNTLKCFTSQEIEEIICGCSNETWDNETLFENTVPNHGFDKNSPIYRALLQIISEMNNIDKKKFLLFVTGSPRLPLGGKFTNFILGFKNLTPKLTIVKKQPTNPLENPDSYLPTVMTCQNYLKIPVYSSMEVLKDRLYLAMSEGGNAFHLS